MRVKVANLLAGEGHRHVLDLPAGSGELSYLLMQRGIDVTPADLEPEVFIVPGHSCIRADMNARLPFVDEKFDAVACVEGIEHIENPHSLVREVHRVLKPGGRVYITTPNILSIRSRLSYLLRGYPNQFNYMIEVDRVTGREQAVSHINPIGFLEIRYVLARYGFQVERVDTNVLLGQGSVWYRLLERILRTRGRRAAASDPAVAGVRATLLTDALLYGDNLIIVASK